MHIFLLISYCLFSYGYCLFALGEEIKPVVQDIVFLFSPLIFPFILGGTLGSIIYKQKD